MVAIRGKNLRSGDLAEELGLLLLQQLALVAPVPRTEDVGIDAVATLMRDFDNRRYFAEDNFFVQIKSESVASVEYKDHQVKWLYDLELPFFIATVSRKTSSIQLFCAHRLSNAFITNHDRSKVILHLDEMSTTDELVGENDENVHIGPPVLEWSISSLESDDSFQQVFYEILKKHIGIYKKNLASQKIGWVDLLRWKPNKKPEIFGKASAKSREYAERQRLAEESLDPYLANWLSDMLLEGKWSSTAESIFSLMKKIKRRAETLKTNKAF